jgi:hypothetical protein
VQGGTAAPFAWSNLKIGGGGYCTGLDLNADGTMVTRVDVFGAYIGSTTPGTVWQQLITTASMPASAVGSNANYPYVGGGCKEIRIAPNNSSVLYMIYNNGVNGFSNNSSVFVSTNKGASWTLTTLAGFTTNPNDNQYEYYGQNLAIDPNNSAVCYVGTPSNGIWFTTDTGATWTQISSGTIPNPTAGTGYFGIAFDPTSGTTGGKTNRILVPVFGIGFYESNNAGSTWASVASAPTAIAHGKVGIDGTYYCVSPYHGDVYRLTTANVWKDIMAAGTYRAATTIACDPANKDNLIVSCDGGYLNISANATVTTPTWSGVNATNNGNGQPAGNAGAHFVTAADVPWIQASQDYYLSDGDLWYDPSVSGRLWFSYGIGVLYSNGIQTPPGSGQQQWISQTAGIENLVANYISWSPSKYPIVASWDRPFFTITNPNAYQANYGPNYTTAVQNGYSVDYATTSTDFIVGLVSITPSTAGVYSTDGGITWQNMTGTIPGLGGTIVAVDTSHFVVGRSNSGSLYNTTDGGATWAHPASAPTSGWGISVSNQAEHPITKDMVNTSTIYAYNYTTPGLWISTDKGVTWSLQFSGHISGNDAFMAQIKAVPGQAGNLFFTSGITSDLANPHPNGQLFYRSTNSGATWTSVANVQDVTTFGFSAANPSGGTYPAVGIVGWVSQNGGATYTWGIWRSDDNCVTWTQIGDFPPRYGTGGWIDEASCMEGDPNNWNRWIVGFQGSSCAYYGPGAI